MNKDYNNYIISVIGGLTTGFIIIIIPELLKVIFDKNIKLFIKIIFLIGMILFLIWSLLFVGNKFFLKQKKRTKELNKLIITSIIFILINIILECLINL